MTRQNAGLMFRKIQTVLMWKETKREILVIVVMKENTRLIDLTMLETEAMMSLIRET